ncbi:aspartate carbamoyltransferase catalytic subunit [Hyphococcus flavus]|uniref:Aspartate carbamoyltransferase n=1 Tax=Hyphococcus flavus TaxID=1866326 RepID=A0AAF0CFH3_9PROT|nr:aspartate carbamoyltransferase catalytic subunit [Hyphococcus flavus]WDI31394.1 aspartate carbamoyltransferase catalytic subunit [Hyphococcus flavus]
MTLSERPLPPKGGFSARRLISIDDLTDGDIFYLLDLAEYYAGYLRRAAPAPRRLAGKTQINLFFEDSTRTNLSFDLAGKKLGADIINVPVSASSVHKGESLVDTAQTLAAMGAHVMIVRAKEEGLHEALDEILPCPVVNGGAGKREHPTQALLDAAAIRSEFGELEDLTIAICGDIKHSRVAGSDARLFQRLGANVRFVGPAYLMPPDDQFTDIPRIGNLKDGLNGADIAMGLRMQFERMEGPDGENGRALAQGFYDEFGLTHETLKLAKPGAWVMHPGPMNRGVEICGALADDPEQSLILRQVFYGVATRMACLDALLTKGE